MFSITFTFTEFTAVSLGLGNGNSTCGLMMLLWQITWKAEEFLGK